MDGENEGSGSEWREGKAFGGRVLGGSAPGVPREVLNWELGYDWGSCC